MMYTSQELMIYGIGYKTLSRFWSVKHNVIRNTYGAKQTKELIAFGQTQARADRATFRSRVKQLFSSLWHGRKSGGGGGTYPPRFSGGGHNIKSPPRFWGWMNIHRYNDHSYLL